MKSVQVMMLAAVHLVKEVITQKSKHTKRLRKRSK